MNTNRENIEEYIIKQAEVFLLELGTFHPFGCAITKTNEVKPIGAYLEGENPSVKGLIDLLENGINQKLNDGEYLLAAIATDVTIKKDNNALDAVEIRIFQKGKEQDIGYIKYKIKAGSVDFLHVDL